MVCVVSERRLETSLSKLTDEIVSDWIADYVDTSQSPRVGIRRDRVEITFVVGNRKSISGSLISITPEGGS